MGQIQLTVSLIMIGLFTAAIISFAVNFAIENEVNVSVSDDSELSNLLTVTKGNLSSFREDSNATYQSIVSTNIAATQQVAKNVGSFALTPGNAISVVKGILEVSYTKIFGSNNGFSVFLTALISIIVFMIGLFLYKTLRGNPD